MIKLMKSNSNNIKRRSIRLLWFFDISIYNDRNIGNHYGFAVGYKDYELHLLFRQWDEYITMKKSYDA